MGRSLKNNLYNLNLTDVFASVLADYGVKLENLYECEPDAGLGNGGLGRLAACYLDALATDGYPQEDIPYFMNAEFSSRSLLTAGRPSFRTLASGGEVWLVPTKRAHLRFALRAT